MGVELLTLRGAESGVAEAATAAPSPTEARPVAVRVGDATTRAGAPGSPGGAALAVADGDAAASSASGGRAATPAHGVAAASSAPAAWRPHLRTAWRRLVGVGGLAATAHGVAASPRQAARRPPRLAAARSTARRARGRPPCSRRSGLPAARAGRVRGQAADSVPRDRGCCAAEPSPPAGAVAPPSPWSAPPAGLGPVPGWSAPGWAPAGPPPAGPPPMAWGAPTPAPAPKRSPLTGARLLAWTGGAVTLLGVVLLLALAASRGWFTPPARVAFGAVLGAGLVGLGVWLHRRESARAGALALVATGFATLYLVDAAATAVFGYLPARPGPAARVGHRRGRAGARRPVAHPTARGRRRGRRRRARPGPRRRLAPRCAGPRAPARRPAGRAAAGGGRC